MARHDSKELEDFFCQFELIILERLQKYKVIGLSQKDQDFRKVFKQLNEAKETMVVPTDKTNSYTVVSSLKYKVWVKGHLRKNTDEIPRQEVVRIHHAAELLMEDLKEELSTGEICFL
eukprot:9934720-Ditylum_brightwellii.AAC.1